MNTTSTLVEIEIIAGHAVDSSDHLLTSYDRPTSTEPDVLLSQPLTPENCDATEEPAQISPISETPRETRRPTLDRRRTQASRIRSERVIQRNDALDSIKKAAEVISQQTPYQLANQVNSAADAFASFMRFQFLELNSRQGNELMEKIMVAYNDIITR